MKRVFIFLAIIQVSISTSQTISEIENAHLAYASNDCEKAIVDYRSLISKNPTKGDYYYKLADCLRKTGDYQASNDVYKQCLELGYKDGRSIKYIAENYALLSNHNKALHWIKKGLNTPKSIYYEDLKTNKSFDNLRPLEEFKLLNVSALKEESSRIDKWEADLKFLKMSFETIHYNLFDKITQEEWEDKNASLIKSVPSLSDDEIVFKLMQLVSAIGDGHTFVRPPLQGKLKFHFYPIQLYQFEEGVFVTAINEEYEEVVGSQLTHIDGMPINEVLELFKTVVSVDNSMGYKENVYLSMLSEILYNLGVTNEKTEASFTFKKDNESTLTLKVTALDFNPSLWNTTVNKGNQLPLYRSNPSDYFWYEHLKSENALYLQLNINFSMPNKTIESFYDEVFTLIKEEKVKTLMLDIRNCPGGNSFNNKSLLNQIIKNDSINQKGRFYTIIGRKTFSAAMNLATDIEQKTNVIFIGEPTGSSPNFIGETNFVELPNSKLNISISNAYWQRSVSWDNRKWIAPDIYLPPSFDSYRENEDPVLEFILSSLKN